MAEIVEILSSQSEIPPFQSKFVLHIFLDGYNSRNVAKGNRKLRCTTTPNNINNIQSNDNGTGAMGGEERRYESGMEGERAKERIN